MLKFTNSFINTVKKYYLIIIVIFLFISYGQILFMLPWQDDNAMFFKLAHITEPAGFLGNGMLGEGAYKYTAFFYYPIYLLFHYQTFYYFLFCFILYAVSTYVVYKVASRIFNENSGMLAGFLYACGFIGSDSYIRLFNSIITSLSVILVCLFLNYYWSYFKEKNIKWYLLAMAFFFMAAEFARARTHYLLLVAVLFELVFFAFKKPLFKSFVSSLLRLLPLFAVFYRYVIAEDFRSKEAGNFLTSILHGEFYKIFGFLSSLPNLVLPNWLIGLLSPASISQATKNYLSNSAFYFAIIGILAFSSLVYLFIKYKKARIYIATFVACSILWKYVSSIIFVSAFLTASSDQILFAFIGGELLFLGGLGLLFIGTKHKALYFVLFSGILINLLSYSAYNPTQIYEKINRYLSHSFLFLIIFGSFIYFTSKGKFKKIVLIFLICWGLNNLFEGYFYQRSILQNRTRPVVAFYKEFERLVKDVKKDDIIYFDVADNMRSQFADSFSVAQMPNTTAIAWRYGIDRDDFLMFEDPEGLFNYLKINPLKDGRIRTFFYAESGLKDTTKEFLEYLSKSKQIIFEINKSSNDNSGKSEVEISEDLKISSLVPTKIIVSMIAKPINLSNQSFPISYGLENQNNRFYKNSNLSDLAFEYNRFRKLFERSIVSVSSTWQGRVGSNLVDGDTNTTWQADRLLWLKEEQNIVIKMNNIDNYSRLTFINTYSDSSPLEFEMFYSDDLKNWKTLGVYKNNKRLGNGELVTVDFDNKLFGNFKIKFSKTLNGDSPAIAEVLLIPTRFATLDVKEANEYLKNPFANIPDSKTYNNLLKNTSLIGNVELYWMNNKNFGWQKNASTNTQVIFDGREHSYEMTIPAGGTEINKLKFTSTNFPGELIITKLQVSY